MYQACLPSRCITAGVMVMRTMNASISTPTASENPMARIIDRWANTNPENTLAMIRAAAVTTGAACAKPERTAARARWPWA